MIEAFFHDGLFGWAGLFNPVAIAIAAFMGWHANARAKLFVAAFSAVALSLLVDVALRALSIPSPTLADQGVVALFPFRFLGASIAAILMFWVRPYIKEA